MLSLHGAGGRGSKNIKNLRNWNEWMAAEDLRRKHPAFVLAPQTGISWSDPKSPLIQVPEIPDEMIQSYPVEMRRWMKRWQARGSGARREDLGTVFELIDSVLMKEFKIDADRVYCLGRSMGGAGTFTAIYLQPAKGFTTAYASDRPDKTDDIWDWLFKHKRWPAHDPHASMSFIFNSANHRVSVR